MSDRQFPTPSSDQVIKALERTGFLLEQRVAKKISEANFYVYTGRAYKDPEEGKSREIDVYAFREFYANKERDITVGVKLLVECKNSSGPYVVLGRKPSENERTMQPHAHTLPVESVKYETTGGDGRVRFMRKSTWSWLGLHDLPHGPGRDGRKGMQLVRMHMKSGEWNADNASIFDSLTLPLVKAVEAFRPIRDLSNSVPSFAHMHLCFPIVVTSGELFYVDAHADDPSAESVEWVSIERDIDMVGVTGKFSMDVVSYSSFSSYLNDRVVKFAEEVAAVVGNDPEKIRTREIPPPE
ncbi:hypothetical protein [Streptomyces sp. NPDC057253]|uniref:hypothetical protein n=1 Tax=Streptomyces sp. NPDC057253 TaxID=3346069 RepID=UPI0036317BC6